MFDLSDNSSEFMKNIDFIRDDEQVEDLQIGGYKLIQKKEGFRFGLDAVLVANYAADVIRPSDKVIDLGTGSGVITVLVAAKTKATDITGLEIQPEIGEMAGRSVLMNNLQDRVKIMVEDLRKSKEIFQRGSFDHVVSNPPYKKAGSGLVNPSDNKALSRHEILCTLRDVIENASYLLKDGGYFTMVHRPERLNDIIELMRKHSVEPKFMKFVHPFQGKAPNLILVRGVKRGRAFLKIEDPLYIFNDDGTYSDEVNRIYCRGD